jgi:SET domain-containing protein
MRARRTIEVSQLNKKISRKSKTAARRRPKQPLFRIGRSRTGLGLFAVVPIRRGRFIARYSGKRVRWEDADHRAKYLFHLGREWAIDGSPRSNIARYINHSCKPNAVPYMVGGKIHIYARRRIEPGEEIGYDYGKEYFDLILKPIGCKCDACQAPRPRRKTTRRPSARR